MRAPLKINGITVITYNHPCNNHCRFCSAGRKHFDNVPFDCFVTVMERFLDWKESEGCIETFAPFILYTHALMTYEQSKKYRELCKRGGYNPLPLQMNGCILMPEDDMARILEEHRRAGYDKLSLTFSGNRKVHDIWAGRHGEFDQLLRIARIGAELGYKRNEQLFLTGSSIPVLEELLDCLDDLPGEKNRSLYPVNYIGFAQNLEKERPDRAMLDTIPERARPYLELWDGIYDQPYKTEREWVEWVDKNYNDDAVRERFLGITLDESNAPRLLSEDCGTIFEDYRHRFENVYRMIPEITELAKKYGDTNNEKLYSLYELERKWVEQYMAEYLSEYDEDYRISDF